MSETRHHRQIARHVRAAGSSFYWAMRLQEKNKRQALFAVYAYCRTLDDIADGPLTQQEKTDALSRWRNLVTSLYSDTEEIKADSDEDLVHALRHTIEVFELPKEPLLALIRGMETDINAPLSAPAWLDLMAYCDDVASAVGELCLAVWGWRGADANAFAQTTGRALQLTNILRDVWADAEVGRLYLPREALDAAGISSSVPNEVIAQPQLPDACRWVSDKAARLYEEIHGAWPKPFPRTLRAAHVMVTVYRKLFDKIVVNDWSRQEKISLGTATKVTSVASALLRHP